MGEYLADVVAACAKDGEDRIADPAFEGASGQSAVRFHVADLGFDGAASLDELRQRRGNAAPLTAVRTRPTLDAMAAIHNGESGPPQGRLRKRTPAPRSWPDPCPNPLRDPSAGSLRGGHLQPLPVRLRRCCYLSLRANDRLPGRGARVNRRWGDRHAPGHEHTGANGPVWVVARSAYRRYLLLPRPEGRSSQATLAQRRQHIALH